MKRYQMLMLEWDIESGSTRLGGAIGAGIGALGSGGVWAYKRLQLKKKMDACNGDPKCEEQVQNEIKSLRNKALIGGAVATVGGGTLGYGGQGLINSKAKDLLIQDLSRDEQELEARKIDLNNRLKETMKKDFQTSMKHPINTVLNTFRTDPEIEDKKKLANEYIKFQVEYPGRKQLTKDAKDVADTIDPWISMEPRMRK